MKTHLIDQQNPLAGILFLIGSVFTFSVQDALIKHLSGGYPLFEIMFIRSVAALIPSLVIVHLDVGLKALKTGRPWAHFIRGLLLFFSYLLYYLGVASLPLAENIALFYTAPFFISILSMAVLSERVAINRWGSLILGFSGVIVMINPRTGIADPAALFPVLAAIAYAVSVLITRRVAGSESASVMSFTLMLVYMALSGIPGVFSSQLGSISVEFPGSEFLFRPWILPPPVDLALLISLGLTASIGFYGLTQAYRLAEASTIAPFEYTGMLPTAVWGFLFWNEIPNSATLAGISLIIVSGIYLIRQGKYAKPLVDSK